jgi:hypothetical protein
MLLGAALDILKRKRDEAADLEEAMATAKRRLFPQEVPRNPDRAPPLDPFVVTELQRMGRAVDAEFRWHFMMDANGEGNRCWSIQKRVSVDHWVPVYICYDGDKACEGNWTPYKHPDASDLLDFWKTDLAKRFNTGDVKKDLALRNKEKDEEMAAKKKKLHEEGLMDIFLKISGGDPRRKERFLNHAAQHTPDGCGFKEFYSVGIDLKKGGS